MITLANVDKFHNFFTVKFRSELQMKLKLKLPPRLKSVIMLPCEKYVYTVQLYNFTFILLIKNMLNIMWQLFDKFLIC